MRDQAVGGLALGLHGAAFGDGDLGCDFAQGLRRFGFRQRAFAKAKTADQGTVHDQIGISPDRGGKMGVTAQIQAEMAVILRRIFGLGL